jgi:hypothetical protein
VLPMLREAGHFELHLERDAVDLWRFRDHLRQARRLRNEHQLQAVAAFERAEHEWLSAQDYHARHPSMLPLVAPYFVRQREALVCERRQGRMNGLSCCWSCINQIEL